MRYVLLKIDYVLRLYAAHPMIGGAIATAIMVAAICIIGILLE